MNDADIKKIEERIGYSFNDKNFVKLVFTHKSRDPEHNYERLEFLGDAIAGAIVSEYLYLLFEKSTEGELSKARANMVNLGSLYKIALTLDITEFILTEGIDGKNKRIIGNVYEALIGAIFLDSSYEKTREILLIHLNISGLVSSLGAGKFMQNDFKSKLQELIQKEYNIVPKYQTVKKEGPDHRSTFTVCVKVENKILGYGDGPSKKIAEQLAAKNALEELKP